MSQLGEQLRLRAVRFERHLPAPVDVVWVHLTDCRKLPSWYGDDGVIEPREGGVVKLMNGHIRGVVTQWQPPRRLTYSWNVFGPGETVSAYPESYLDLQLHAGGAGTKLTLLHLPVLERFETQNAMGWHSFLDMLDDAVAGKPVQPRGTYMQANAPRYGIDLGKLQK